MPRIQSPWLHLTTGEVGVKVHVHVPVLGRTFMLIMEFTFPVRCKSSRHLLNAQHRFLKLNPTPLDILPGCIVNQPEPITVH